MSSPCCSNQAIGKALNRAQTSYPSSPRKKWRIVESLAQTVRLSIACSLSSCTHVSTVHLVRILLQSVMDRQNVVLQVDISENATVAC